jgi:hypothetical protein
MRFRIANMLATLLVATSVSGTTRDITAFGITADFGWDAIGFRDHATAREANSSFDGFSAGPKGSGGRQ